MKTYKYADLSETDISELVVRQGVDLNLIKERVLPVWKDIATRGDAAVRDYTKQFDGVDLDQFKVTEAELEASERLVSDEFKAAIKVAAKNIRKFHEAQVSDLEKIETMPGVFCWRQNRPIESVGCYIPGGTAPLFSTLLMSVIPAQVAGCPEIIVCTPPQKDGSLHAEMCWTAQYLGVKNLFKVGGAQAIFAMTEGTTQIPAVLKLVGPGNQYVTAAKMLASEKVALDMPAGPSEVLIIATKDSNPVFVAADLLSQAEHGADSEAILVGTDETMIEAIKAELKIQLSTLPRSAMAEKSLSNSYAVLTEDLKQAFTFSNTYAPEHLILAFDDYESCLPDIVNAGSVFCGSLTCESFGDYASGTNHTLPTSGFAKNYSGVSVDTFVKKMTFQSLDSVGCKNLGPHVEILAEKEELQAHKNAVTLRLKSL